PANTGNPPVHVNGAIPEKLERKKATPAAFGESRERLFQSPPSDAWSQLRESCGGNGPRASKTARAAPSPLDGQHDEGKSKMAPDVRTRSRGGCRDPSSVFLVRESVA